MTKDVLLSIKGLQFANEQDTEPVEVITSGDYYKWKDLKVLPKISLS